VSTVRENIKDEGGDTCCCLSIVFVIVAEKPRVMSVKLAWRENEANLKSTPSTQFCYGTNDVLYDIHPISFKMSQDVTIKNE
jgi:hypothetical protein